MPQMSRVAELLFLDAPLGDFARMVGELELVLQRHSDEKPRLSWDCDDVASFDLPGLRILLSQSESPYPGYAHRMVVSVGPSRTAAPQDQVPMVYASICAKLTTRLKHRLRPDELRWSEISGVVTAEDVDTLATGLTEREALRRRPGIFTPRIGGSPEAEPALDAVRAALCPQRSAPGQPRGWGKAVNHLMSLAAVTALFPVAVLHYAASFYRIALRP